MGMGRAIARGIDHAASYNKPGIYNPNLNLPSTLLAASLYL
jgi:hypothetical protein